MSTAIVPAGDQSSAVVVADDWKAMRDMAQTLVKSGFLPKAVNTPEKAIAIILAGKEIGLGPMQSLRSIHIVDGKPTMGAELMMALALKHVPGGYLKITESTNQRCVVKAGRSKNDTAEYIFTLEDAKRAGLLSKSNWKNYPRAMLRSRVISEAVKAVFPDALIGAYTADELGAEHTTEDGGPDMSGTPDDFDNPDEFYERIVECMTKNDLDDLALELKGKSFATQDRLDLGAAWKTRLGDIKRGAIADKTPDGDFKDAPEDDYNEGGL